MTIAITGVTGQLGQHVVAALRDMGRADDVVGIARSPEKAVDLGISIRKADYEDLASLEAAFEGVATVLLISSSEIGKRVAQHRNVIAAAEAAGVARVAYTSILHADTTPLMLGQEHRASELSLIESGLAYTLLRNGWYTENYAAGIPVAIQAGAFIGCAGTGRIASATRRDYAEAAAKVLTGEGHENRIYELAGDTAYTRAEMAGEVSRLAGGEIPYHDLTQAGYAEALASAGLPQVLCDLLADSDAGAAKGGLFGDERHLSQLIGRPTTPMAETVKAMMP
ncbi:SDR family oxidoreductase [Jiella sp. MQZ9-1]|uniref:SDR family oxidoreductase n=1 Tax=Jiella flava TaxID=2816857 RepID=A0A939G0H9_9HYPH|nr:SDR family oxidoreductase [Jiella flava]MBO0664126.1 SDR family oxidoreductase [Jiella flava]MCD2472698.1 SDR family oxidoreductase [Jiella flava]